MPYNTFNKEATLEELLVSWGWVPQPLEADNNKFFPCKECAHPEGSFTLNHFNALEAAKNFISLEGLVFGCTLGLSAASRSALRLVDLFFSFDSLIVEGKLVAGLENPLLGVSLSAEMDHGSLKGAFDGFEKATAEILSQDPAACRKLLLENVKNWNNFNSKHYAYFTSFYRFHSSKSTDAVLRLSRALYQHVSRDVVKVPFSLGVALSKNGYGFMTPARGDDTPMMVETMLKLKDKMGIHRAMQVARAL